MIYYFRTLVVSPVLGRWNVAYRACSIYTGCRFYGRVLRDYEEQPDNMWIHDLGRMKKGELFYYQINPDIVGPLYKWFVIG